MCDFFNSDCMQIQTGKNECREKCIITEKCSHYVWSDDGDCCLKNGFVTKKDAIQSTNTSKICGIVSEGISRTIKIKHFNK
jgi:hypothetical protein